MSTEAKDSHSEMSEELMNLKVEWNFAMKDFKKQSERFQLAMSNLGRLNMEILKQCKREGVSTTQLFDSLKPPQ